MSTLRPDSVGLTNVAGTGVEQPLQKLSALHRRGSAGRCRGVLAFTRHFGSALVLVFGWLESAEAYIDPGAASIVLQCVVGAVAAAFVLVRGWGESLRKFLRRFLVRRHSDVRIQRKG